jgi:hypothetical protein
MDDHRAPTVDAMQRLVYKVTGAGAVLDEHMNDYDESLPHLLMADLGRWLVNAVATGDERSVADFLAAVEFLYTSEDPMSRPAHRSMRVSMPVAAPCLVADETEGPGTAQAKKSLSHMLEATITNACSPVPACQRSRNSPVVAVCRSRNSPPWSLT